LFVRGLGVATGWPFQGWDLEGFMFNQSGSSDLLSRTSEPRVQGAADPIDVDLRRGGWLQLLAALIYEGLRDVLEELGRHLR